MHRLIKNSVVFLLVAALVIIPLTGSVMAAETLNGSFDGRAYYKRDIRGEAMLADLVLVRPVGILATITGGILWVFTLPFSLGEKTWPETRSQVGVNVEKFIGEPIQHTFNRRLGDF
jgi:hypothetical protein